MLARTHTFTIDGPRARHVGVEVDVRNGLPGFAIVGLADAAVREARERVQAALRNSGYQFPSRRITVSLTPAGLPKSGPGLDLALACAVLAASGQLPAEQLERIGLFGELALDGSVRACPGTVAVAGAARELGLTGIAVAPAAAPEAQLVEGLRVLPVEQLRSAVRVLSGGSADRASARPHDALVDRARESGGDLADVRGQPQAVLALLIAAAGPHSLLLSGAPGTGKTMLARRLPSLLPELTPAEKVEVLSLTGRSEPHDCGEPGAGVRRPFRAPHHSVSAAGLVGGAGSALGEAVLAHRGVLFLDELSEFSRSALEALRQPLEEGRVTIARAGVSSLHPTSFLLVAATNPCPCGLAGERERCECSAAEVARYRRRLSGPLLDRIDLMVDLHRRRSNTAPTALIDSRTGRGLVAAARRRRVEREARSAESGEPRQLSRRCEELIAAARARGMLSARREQRLRAVARTIADLAGSEEVLPRHVASAAALCPAVAEQAW